LFQHGSYESVPVGGPHAEHVIAFARSLNRKRVAVAVGRHFAPLTDGGRNWPSGWQGAIEQPGAAYEQLIGDDRSPTGDLSFAALFRHCPVSVLRRL
jgi:(1->4)-alpha-D-glucan 1-alpha-D-glucosylmutase